MKYILKPKVIEAMRWMKHGDHDSVRKETKNMSHCHDKNFRGLMTVMGKDVSITKGDYIITIEDFSYPVKPDKFNEMYVEYVDPDTY